MNELNLYRGTGKCYRAITRNRVQIELNEVQEIFELFIDQSWVISHRNKLILSGMCDDTGEVCCYAYCNVTKSVQGWRNQQTTLVAHIFIWGSLIFIIIKLTLFPPHLITFIFTYIGWRILKSTKENNKIFSDAYEMIKSA